MDKDKMKVGEIKNNEFVRLGWTTTSPPPFLILPCCYLCKKHFRVSKEAIFLKDTIEL